jgi:hypothetical protein
MADIRALPNGTILQVLTAFDAARTPDPAASISLDVDDLANAALLSDIQTNGAAYSLMLFGVSAQLQKHGVPVPIAAASALYSIQSAILAGVPESMLEAAIVALWNGTATAAQQQKALAYCLLKLHQSGVI